MKPGRFASPRAAVGGGAANLVHSIASRARPRQGMVTMDGAIAASWGISAYRRRCRGLLSPDTRFCRLIPTPVLPLNSDTSFAAPSPSAGLARATPKEYKCQGQHTGTLFSARTAHATADSLPRPSGHCPTGRTRSKRQLHCALLGPCPPHRAATGAAPPPARPKRPRRFVPQPGLPALDPVPHVG